MNLAAAANIIRLRRSGAVEPDRTTNEPSASGPSLLAREDRPATGPVTQQIRQEQKTLLIGLDLGTSHTRIAAVVPGVEQFYLRRKIPTAVAYHALPDEKTISPFLYFGQEATSRGDRFRVVHPWQDGDLADPVLAREFIRHLRELMRRQDLPCSRAVVAVPVTMSPEGRHHLTQAMRGLLDQVVFLPRPYLAALGLRDHLGEKALRELGDRQVLLADLGAGATEVCRMGSHFPGPQDMKGTAFGGAAVELLVQECLRQKYPALRPDRAMIRGWLENFGFVGRATHPVVVRLPVDGVEQSFNITQAISRSAEVWSMHVQQLLLDLLENGGGDKDQPTHVFLCGGGSQLDNLGSALGELLVRVGRTGVTFSTVEEKDLSLASRGALLAARKIRENQWPRFELA